MGICMENLKTCVRRSQKGIIMYEWLIRLGPLLTQKLEIDLKAEKRKKEFLFGRLMRDIISWGLRGGSQVVRPATVSVFIHDGNDRTSHSFFLS